MADVRSCEVQLLQAIPVEDKVRPCADAAQPCEGTQGLCCFHCISSSMKQPFCGIFHNLSMEFVKRQVLHERCTVLNPGKVCHLHELVNIDRGG